MALLGFGTLHALWIVPIWAQLLRGLPFALVGAAAVGWGYAEVLKAGRLPNRPLVGGLLFGVGAWLVLLPVTTASALFRLSGLHRSAPTWVTVFELGIGALTGLVIGRWLGRGWRPTLAVVIALEVLLAVQAGPVPIVNSERALGLLLLLALLYAACGTFHGGLTAWFARQLPLAAVPPN